MNNRRRSDILVNTFHIDAIVKMSPEQRSNVSAERHAILICSSTHESEGIIRNWLEEIGVDPDITIFFWDGDELQWEHCVGVISDLKKLGYDHGYHFDVDSERIAKILEELPDTRIVKI